jgi:hypothetical protein
MWQQMMGYASVGLILIALPFGLWQVWRRYRTNPVAVLLGLTAMTYPVTLALRLTRAGTETSNRSSEFVFLGVAFVVAVALTRLLVDGGSRLTGIGWLLPRVRSFVLVGAGVVMFFGGVIVGWPPYALQPGPYRVGADPRSIDATGIEAALWAGAHLPPSSRLLTDRTNGLLMGSYGLQDPVTGAAAGGFILANVFFSDTIGTAELTALQTDKIAYLVVDHRLATGVPLIGYYFESDEPGAFQWRIPIALAALTKFDLERTMSRVYDNGAIVIYRYDPVAGVRGAGVTPARSPTPSAVTSPNLAVSLVLSPNPAPILSRSAGPSPPELQIMLTVFRHNGFPLPVAARTRRCRARDRAQGVSTSTANGAIGRWQPGRS